MLICEHQNEGQLCPISKGKCPGICIYAEIFEGIDMGIMVLNIKSKELIFQSNHTKLLFNQEDNAVDYQFISSLFFSKMSDADLRMRKSGPYTLNRNGIILGYSIYYISNDFLWLFITDITEKQRLESIAEAMNTMDNVGYIFSGIRHELGNPVNSIKMTLSVLKNNLDKFSPETIYQYVERSLGEILRVEYLLKSLRSFSLFEKAEIQEIDITLFLNKLLTLVEVDCEKNGISLKLNSQDDVKWIQADPRLLKQVMLNLLVNAMDAVEGRDDPCITIKLFRSLGLIWLRVEDNGCGIKDDLLREIFKPLYTSKPHGTGLGMPLSKKMLACMNGTIDVESLEDVGTSIIISLPEGGK